MKLPDSIEPVEEAPRRRVLELVQGDERRHDLDALVALADCVFSRYLATPRRHSPADTHVLGQMLARYAHAPAFIGATQLPPIDASLSPGGVRDGETGLRRLGWLQDDVRERFQDLEDTLGPLARFDRETLDGFGLLPFQHVLAAMIADGPGIAAQRAERALRATARTPVRATARRPSGPPCKQTIVRRRDELRRLMGVIVTMRRLEYPAPQLERWVAIPPVRVPDMAPLKLDTSGVPFPLLRRRAHELDAEIASALRLRAGEDELAALETLPRWAGWGLFRLLRERVVLDLLIYTVGRAGAIGRLLVDDLHLEHVGPPPDLLAWAVLLLRPAKALHQNVARPKPIPPDVVRHILVLHAWTERYRRLQLGLPEEQAPLQRHHPLLAASPKTLRPLGGHGVQAIARGSHYAGRDGERRSGHRLPLIARGSGLNPDLPAEKHRFVGYNTLAYRHTASQLAERAGEIWNREHPSTGGEPSIPPALYATAIQDHKPPGDPLRATYGDRNTEAAYELLSGRAAQGIWRLMNTREGARKVPDLEAIRDAVTLRAALQSEERLLQQRSEELYRSQPPEDPTQQLAHLTRLTQELHHQHDLIGRCKDRVRELDLRLQQLRLDEHSFIELPDDAPTDLERVDLDVLAASFGEPGEGTSAAAGPVRHWATVIELARIADVERSTVCFWLKGTHLPRVERRPWQADAVPVDISLGRNYRRICLWAIREQFWSPEMRARCDQILARWPVEKGWLVGGEPGPRCHAPLDLPPPWRTTGD